MAPLGTGRHPLVLNICEWVNDEPLFSAKGTVMVRKVLYESQSIYHSDAGTSYLRAAYVVQ